MRALALLLLSASLGACAPTRPQPQDESAALISEERRARPESHPAWTRLYGARDVDDEPVAPIFEEHAVTVVVVFATWCEACRRELEILRQLAEEEPRAGVIGVNWWEEWRGKSDAARMQAWARENAPWLRVVRGNRALVGALGGVPKIPSLFLFDADGKLVASFERDERPPPDLPELVGAVQAVIAAE